MHNKQKFGNITYVREASENNIQKSVDLGLMHQFLDHRHDKLISYDGKENLVEFLNCSYLGLDTHQALRDGATELIQKWGTHIGCVRTRFSIEPHHRLEERLGHHFGGHAITFASVSTTHMSVLPLVANGMLLRDNVTRPLLIFDRFAHSSMQCLRPIAAQEADVASINNNDLNELEELLKIAKQKGQTAVYLTDSVYSMGGLSPLDELIKLTENYDLYLYLDDAHGTSVFGEQGEGYVIEHYNELPERVILVFSLSKAFGCNGGGVVFPRKEQKRLTTFYGQIYTFSSALPWGMIGAALASLDLHQDGTVRQLQHQLKDNIHTFCTAMEIPIKPYMSPVQGMHIGDPEAAMAVGKQLTDNGYYAPIVFFPVVPRDNARVRICLSAKHTPAQLEGFAHTLKTAIREHQLEIAAV